MVNRWVDMRLVAAGVVTGILSGGLAQSQEQVLSAQSGRQCRSWTLESNADVDAAAPWLGMAARVEIATAGLDIAGRNRQAVEAA